MELYTKNRIADVAEGRSGLDAKKFDLEQIPYLMQQIVLSGERIADDLSRANREAALQQIERMGGLLADLKLSITAPSTAMKG